MTVRTCPICAHPMADAWQSTACPQCFTHLERDLAQIPALVTELNTTITRQSRTALASGYRLAPEPYDAHDGLGVHVQALPFHQGASDALGLLHSTLWPWVREAVEDAEAIESGVTPMPVPSTVGLSRWLLGRMGWLVRHPDGANCISEVTYAVQQAERAIDTAPDKVYAGTCDGPDECLEELYAIAEHDTVRCPVCGTERDIVAWRTERLDQADEMLLPLSTITRVIGETTRETVSRKQLEGWIRRGRLVRSGNIGAVATYRIGDVRDILRATQRAQLTVNDTPS